MKVGARPEVGTVLRVLGAMVSAFKRFGFATSAVSLRNRIKTQRWWRKMTDQSVQFIASNITLLSVSLLATALIVLFPTCEGSKPIGHRHRLNANA